MVIRVLIVASSLNQALLLTLLWPLGSGAVVLMVVGAVLFLLNRRRADTSPAIKLKTPFDLATALKLAELIGLISLMAKWLIAAFGENALTVLAALSGLADWTPSLCRSRGGCRATPSRSSRQRSASASRWR